MSNPTFRARVLALAGVFQAAALVKQLARTGRVDEQYFTSSIESIFKIDAENVLDVYGKPEHLTLGLNELIKLFANNKQPKDSEIARYVFSLLHLERKLISNSKMLTMVRAGIERAANQANHFSSTHENVMANLASLYTDTLSTFSFRIQVAGEPIYLNQTHVLNKVRALLLTGIRSAVLWRQLEGKRWQLVLYRTLILETAKQWLQAKIVETV
jgi:high frequency lysogenization protein